MLAFAASGSSPFSGGQGVSAASVLYRVVHATPELGTVPTELRELVQACLAKDPAWRPDLGQVAARCGAAAEYLGMSPVAFWPPEVARVIEAQQAALAAEVEALPTPLSVLLPVLEGSAGPAGWPTPGSSTPEPSRPAESTGAGRATGRTGPSALPPLAGTQVSVSRRSLLIGAGAGGIAVVGGVAAWVIGSRHSPGTSAHPPGEPTTTGRSPGGGRVTGAGGSGPASTAWTFTTGNEILANPGVGKGVVYVGRTITSTPSTQRLENRSGKPGKGG